MLQFHTWEEIQFPYLISKSRHWTTKFTPGCGVVLLWCFSFTCSSVTSSKSDYGQWHAYGSEILWTCMIYRPPRWSRCSKYNNYILSTVIHSSIPVYYHYSERILNAYIWCLLLKWCLLLNLVCCIWKPLEGTAGFDDVLVFLPAQGMFLSVSTGYDDI